MASRQFEIQTCDRCGREAEVKTDHRREELSEWGKLQLKPMFENTSRDEAGFRLARVSVRGDYEGLDLCPDCIAALKDWWLEDRA
jgi:hypothetical protein